MLITRDRMVCLGVLALSIFAWIESANYPEEARVFPRLILLGMFAMTFVLLGKTFILAPADEGPFIQNPRNFILLVVGIAFYILGMSQVGFFTATTIFMLVFSYIIGYRHLPQLAVITAGFIAFLWFVFVWVFKRPLPPEFWQQ